MVTLCPERAKMTLSEFFKVTGITTITEAVSRYLELRSYPDGGRRSEYQLRVRRRGVIPSLTFLNLFKQPNQFYEGISDQHPFG